MVVTLIQVRRTGKKRRRIKLEMCSTKQKMKYKKNEIKNKIRYGLLSSQIYVLHVYVYDLN